MWVENSGIPNRRAQIYRFIRVVKSLGITGINSRDGLFPSLECLYLGFVPAQGTYFRFSHTGKHSQTSGQWIIGWGATRQNATLNPELWKSTTKRTVGRGVSRYFRFDPDGEFSDPDCDWSSFISFTWWRISSMRLTWKGQGLFGNS